jgi:hypothetical protein
MRENWLRVTKSGNPRCQMHKAFHRQEGDRLSNAADLQIKEEEG